MILQKTINHFSIYPKSVFLFDGLGALVSAFSLGVILFKLENTFGIPKSMLTILIVPPIGIAVYDFCCFLLLKKNYESKMSIIAYCNLGYSLLSIILAIYYLNSIHFLGWAYLLTEILIVTIIAVIELQISKAISDKKA